MEDRDRIAAELRDTTIQRLFATGLSLQGAVDLAAEAEVRRRVGTSIDELDEVVRMLRDAVLGLEHRPRRGGLRQEVLRLCGKLPLNAPLALRPPTQPSAWAAADAIRRR
jgi:signal transduction histidine kinase